MQKELRQEESRDHAITALSKALWQAGTKGNILETAQKQYSTGRGATEVTSRQRVVEHALDAAVQQVVAQLGEVPKVCFSGPICCEG